MNPLSTEQIVNIVTWAMPRDRLPTWVELEDTFYLIIDSFDVEPDAECSALEKLQTRYAKAYEKGQVH